MTDDEHILAVVQLFNGSSGYVMSINHYAGYSNKTTF